MAELDDPTDDVTRLELALERIAARAQRNADPPSPAAAAIDAGALAARLDVLIARLRSVLTE